jgi:hypothetical protein
VHVLDAEFVHQVVHRGRGAFLLGTEVAEVCSLPAIAGCEPTDPMGGKLVGVALVECGDLFPGERVPV